MDILRKKKDKTVFDSFCFWGGREVASEFGVCRVAAALCGDVDGCRHGKNRRNLGKETGKHREEVRWRVEEEADRMWRGGMGRGERRQHCMKNLPPPPTIKKKLSVVLHISEETQTTATPISPRSPATLPSALPRLVYIYVEALDPHVNNIR